MIRGTVLALVVLLGAHGPALSESEEVEMSEKAAKRLSEFTRTGELETCINTSRIRSITPLDSHNFLVRTGVNKFYLNQVSDGCHRAHRPFYRIQYTLSSGHLCRNEIIKVVDNSSGLTGGACGLGSFEKLERIADEPEQEPEEEPAEPTGS